MAVQNSKVRLGPTDVYHRKVHDKVRVEENYFSGTSFGKRIGRLKVRQRRKKMEKQVVLNWITR